MIGDPGKDRVQVVMRFGFRRGWPAHDDDLDLKRAGRLDLGVGRAPAAVLCHKHLDTLVFHERELVSERERPSRKDQLVIRQGVDFRRPVYGSHDVAMLRRLRECGELQPALSEKNSPALSPKSRDGIVHRRDLDPAVIGFARPRGAGEHDKGRAGCATGSDRVGRHARRERMGRVDNGIDVLARQEGRQTLNAAEDANALGNWRLSRVSRRPRQRQNRRNLGLTGDLPRKRARLRRAAENEQVKALQGLAP